MGVCASLAACLCYFLYACAYFEANKYDDDVHENTNHETKMETFALSAARHDILCVANVLTFLSTLAAFAVHVLLSVR